MTAAEAADLGYAVSWILRPVEDAEKVEAGPGIRVGDWLSTAPFDTKGRVVFRRVAAIECMNSSGVDACRYHLVRDPDSPVPVTAVVIHECDEVLVIAQHGNDPVTAQLAAHARARWQDTPTGELAAVLEAAAGRETNHDWRAVLTEAATRLRQAGS